MLRHFVNFLKVPSIKMFFLTAEVEFTDDDSVPGVDIAVPGAPDIPEANLEEGYLTMSRYQDIPPLDF